MNSLINSLAFYQNNRKLSDVKFLIGSPKEIFYGHKFVVALLSNYWKKQMYPQIIRQYQQPKVHEIYLPQEDPRVFELFLEFAYTRHASVQDEIIFKLISFSKRFKTPTLEKYCCSVFESIINSKNCFLLYEFSLQSKNQSWVDLLIMYIQDHSFEIFQNNNCFEGLKENIVKSVLKMENLEAAEIEIFHSLLKWGRFEQSKSRKKKKLSAILKNLLPFIRVELLDFVGLEEVSKLNYYNPKHLYELMMDLFHTINKPLPLLTRSQNSTKQLKVLLIANCRGGQNRVHHIKESIMSTGISFVDVINCHTNTPDYETMLKYHAIVLRNRNYEDIHDSANLGNNLAKYVENGRGLVVIAVNTLINNEPYKIQGRIVHERFIPLRCAERGESQLRKLGQVDCPNHPIMDGVKSFETKNYSHFIETNDINGGKLIAKWDNGFPLITEKRKKLYFGTVVCLNFHPCSTKITNDCGKAWKKNTDGAKIIANSVTYVALKYLKKRYVNEKEVGQENENK
ncbi:btb (poz) domain-containing 2a-related [Anaeramoeba flamelloides]|uniref:Btb (Poz) domain-containing 2a-related n=1 Tax=Anaeramoeba flamelloides TaxID=1746091 RepID=A0ABQ8XQ36_9EUKA|nr:btb (poz) domain-containing 2a-related [Anaeramoeba flamelloides]